MTLVRSILNDSLYCLKNSKVRFIILALSIVFLNQLLSFIFSSQQDMAKAIMERINQSLVNLNSDYSEQQTNYLADQINQLIDILPYFYFPELLISAVTVCGTLAIINCLTDYGNANVMLVLGKIMSYLPGVLLITFASHLLILTGLGLFILPGVFLIYALMLAPIIKVINHANLIHALVQSIKLMFKNSQYLLPVCFCILLAKIIIPVLLAQLIINIPISIGIGRMIILLLNVGISIFFTTYLLRFYLLTTQKSYYKDQ